MVLSFSLSLSVCLSLSPPPRLLSACLLSNSLCQPSNSLCRRVTGAQPSPTPTPTPGHNATREGRRGRAGRATHPRGGAGPRQAAAPRGGAPPSRAAAASVALRGAGCWGAARRAPQAPPCGPAGAYRRERGNVPRRERTERERTERGETPPPSTGERAVPPSPVRPSACLSCPIPRPSVRLSLLPPCLRGPTRPEREAERERPTPPPPRLLLPRRSAAALSLSLARSGFLRALSLSLSLSLSVWIPPGPGRLPPPPPPPPGASGESVLGQREREREAKGGAAHTARRRRRARHKVTVAATGARGDGASLGLSLATPRGLGKREGESFCVPGRPPLPPHRRRPFPPRGLVSGPGPPYLIVPITNQQGRDRISQVTVQLAMIHYPGPPPALRVRPSPAE